MSKNKVSKNYLYNMFYQILTFLTPFIVTPYLARHFGAESLGIYNYTYSIVYWFILLGMMGISIYGNRQIAKVRDDKEKLSQTFSEIFTLQVITVICSLALFYIGCLYLGQQYIDIFLLQGLMVFATMFDIAWFFNGVENFKKIAIRNSIIKLLLLASILIIIKNPSQIVDYVLINVVMTFLGSIVMWIGLKKYIRPRVVKLRDAFKHLKKTVVLFLPQIATTLYVIFTQTLIGVLYHDIRDVAFYNQAYKLIAMALTITTTIGVVMLPRMANAKTKEGIEKIRNVTNKTFKIALFLSFPLAVGIGVCSVYFIPWFLTAEFVKVGYLLAILAPVIIIISLSNVTGTQFLLPNDRDKKYTISVVIGCLVSITFNLILIPYYGAFGAAITTVITECFVLIVQFLWIRKEFNFNGIKAKIVKYSLVSLIMGIVVFGIGQIMGIRPITNVVQLFVGLIMYLGILYVTKDDILRYLINKLKELTSRKPTGGEV